MQTCLSGSRATLPVNFAGTSSLHQRETELQRLPAVELVRRCLNSRSEAAWCEFVRRFQPLIASVIIKTLRRGASLNSGLIDDLVQETYLKLFAHDFKALRRFNCRHEKAFFGFLRVVASNVVQDHFRVHYSLKRGSGKADEDLESVQTRAVSHIGLFDNAEQRILLTQIKNRLRIHASEPDFGRNYAIFRLYFEHGLTAKAIASLPYIGLSTKGVESALGRLTRLIRDAIKGPSGAAAAN